MAKKNTILKISYGLNCSPDRVSLELRNRYRRGYTLRELAEASNVSINTISKLLQSVGVEKRRCGEGKHHAIVRRIEDLEGEPIKPLLQRLYVDEGVSAQGLERRWGVSYTAIRELIWRNGFVLRDCKEAAKVRQKRE